MVVVLSRSDWPAVKQHGQQPAHTVNEFGSNNISASKLSLFYLNIYFSVKVVYKLVAGCSLGSAS